MLKVANIFKAYQGRPLLDGVSFTLGSRETICLLGPSGSGKSTLLLMIAGLESADSGQILWDGKDIASTPAYMRDFGLVFQDYALFPHLDVFGNIAYGLKMKHWDAERLKARVADVLDLINLRGFEHRGVTDLSGGEQQRVALARALAPEPRLLMFDEPLGALDRALRESLLAELRHILISTGLPAIYVTHDQDEASKIADRVLLLHDGRIVRQGSVPDVWAHPGSAWVAEFLGLGNVISARVLDAHGQVETPYGNLPVRCLQQHSPGEMVQLLTRPASSEPGIPIQGRVADFVFQQDRFRVSLEGGLSVYLDYAPKIGDVISARITVECLE